MNGFLYTTPKMIDISLRLATDDVLVINNYRV